jgi:hypothetical protein
LYLNDNDGLFLDCESFNKEKGKRTGAMTFVGFHVELSRAEKIMASIRLEAGSYRRVSHQAPPQEQNRKQPLLFLASFCFFIDAV